MCIIWLKGERDLFVWNSMTCESLAKGKWLHKRMWSFFVWNSMSCESLAKENESKKVCDQLHIKLTQTCDRLGWLLGCYLLQKKL
jgi:hypothetical protein